MSHCQGCSCPKSVTVKVPVPGHIVGTRSRMVELLAKAVTDAAIDFKGDLIKSKVFGYFHYDPAYLRDELVVTIEGRS